MKNCLHLFIILFLFVDIVLSYGYIPHEIIASIAQRFLTPKAREHVQELLPKEANGNLYLIAAWADRVKRQPKYRFTSRMHFISTPHDNPPYHCSITYKPTKIDLVNAIHNYTNRLDPKSDLDFWPRAEALRFLVHFIGDLHQPLHVTGKLYGGNGASAIFEGRKTNLHYVWDTKLIFKHMRELGHNLTCMDEENFITYDFCGGPSYKPYVEHILNLIKSVWRQEISEWVVCNEREIYTFEKETQELLKSNSALFDNKQPHFELNLQEEIYYLKKPSASCPEFWATPLNKLNCQVVWKDYKPGIDLSKGIYYERIKQTRIVEKLLAVAGIRTAAVLNTLLG